MQISPREEQFTKEIWYLLKNKNILSDVIIKKYDNLLKEYAELLKLISLDNSISYLYNISILINSGMFSYQKFNREEPKYIEYFSHNGIHVIMGEGVCRNVAGFTKDLMKNTSYSCDEFHCYFTQKKIDYNENQKGNHVANLIKYNDIYYVYDVFNNDIYNFNNQYMLSSYNYDNYLYYCPKSELDLSDMNSREINRRIIDFTITSIKEKINNQELEQLFLEIQEKRFNHLNDINDFFYDTIDEKRDLVEEVKAYQKIK